MIAILCMNGNKHVWNGVSYGAPLTIGQRTSDISYYNTLQNGWPFVP
jgi:hypothetical protein